MKFCPACGRTAPEQQYDVIALAKAPDGSHTIETLWSTTTAARAVRAIDALLLFAPGVDVALYVTVWSEESGSPARYLGAVLRVENGTWRVLGATAAQQEAIAS